MKIKTSISVFLFIALGVVPVFAQEKSADKEDMAAKFKKLKAELSAYRDDQCEAFGKFDFEGTPISFNLRDADIRDVLTFANPSGCNFVIDESVGKARKTVAANQVPWNVALQHMAIGIDNAHRFNSSLSFNLAHQLSESGVDSQLRVDGYCGACS